MRTQDTHYSKLLAFLLLLFFGVLACFCLRFSNETAPKAPSANMPWLTEVRGRA